MSNKLLFCLLLVVFGQVKAEQYQFETSLGYSESDSDFTDITGYTISGIYYLKPVDDSKGSLFESSFINRSSHIGVSYNDTNIDFTGIETDATASAISARYIFPNDLFPGNGWFVGAGYSKSRGDDAQIGTTETNSYQFELGKYVAKNTTIAVTYGRRETNPPTIDIQLSVPFINADTTEELASVSLSGFIGSDGIRVSDGTISSRSETNVDTRAISLKHLGDWNYYTYTLSLSYREDRNRFKSAVTQEGISLSRFRSNTKDDQYNIEMALYPRQDWRVSLRYQDRNFDGDFDTNTQTIGLGINWFVTRSIALDLAYSEDRTDVPVFGFSGQSGSTTLTTKRTSASITARF